MATAEQQVPQAYRDTLKERMRAMRNDPAVPLEATALIDDLWQELVAVEEKLRATAHRSAHRRGAIKGLEVALAKLKARLPR